MRLHVAGPKDVWAGLIYIAFGGLMFWGALGYRLGTAGRMGPGYFPRVLAVILVAIGVVALVRGLIVRGERIDGIAWKPLALILASSVLFGLLLERAGLVVALVALVLVSASASKEFRFDPKAVAGLVALIGFCVAAFVKGLGVPMPILGTWLEPLAVLAP
ncbi:MAG: tripartite tricarboxylate transporter TctB family protein [Rhodoplanes sp.]|uniref:tripartite tricarboxylate transporter TctB family protein n=1 Tax=Rhodoplanes sp. TaxID=1968906 RepID=UPI0017D4AE22|nr:tripartite tricarboxylate transporter TctB family protein [Rhodoplanes sp.]NVO12630.1 tripartite tricarboxylate transporter TctB family protein [Rhodoplanes sp.]